MYKRQTSAGGLEDEKIYYIVRQSKDKVKLSLSRFESLEFTPEVVNITSTSAGTLSPINPSLDLYKTNTVKFNLSDPSLCSFVGLASYSAFDLNLYTDREFEDVFYSSRTTNTFEVSKSGTVGITTDAGLTLIVNDSLPEALYYKFTPIQNELISDIKKEQADALPF